MDTPDDEDIGAATAAAIANWSATERRAAFAYRQHMAALLAARARADRLLREVLCQEEARGDARPQ